MRKEKASAGGWGRGDGMDMLWLAGVEAWSGLLSPSRAVSLYSHHLPVLAPVPTGLRP